MNHRNRWHRTGSRGDDAGVTLIELMVALSLTGTVLALFTGAVVQMYGAAHRTESVSVAQSELHTALQRLDKEVRYASDITAAGSVGGAWYVELLATVGTPVCIELRLQGGQLQRRTWTENQIATTRSAWLPLASGVRAAGTGAPFTVLPPDVNVGFERLRLRLAVDSGAGAKAASAETDITFTALNTARDGAASDCAEGRLHP
jgi:prepilin-type N-terminal cleavage/methylation domain-containing protein